MQINKNAKYVIGVDLGGTNARAAVIDRNGSIVGEGRCDSRAMEGFDITIGQIIAAIRLAAEKSPVDISECAGVGMGVPGTIRPKEGMVMWSPNFKDWNGVNVVKPIQEATGLPVFIANDANVAALGEFKFGAGKGCSVMVMFTLGTGIGSGLIINGKNYDGVTGTAPEMGHQIILADGPDVPAEDMDV